MKKLYNPTDSSIDTISENQTKVVLKPGESLIVADNVAEEVLKRYGFLQVDETKELPPAPVYPKTEEVEVKKKEPKAKKKSNSLKPAKYESKKKSK